MRKEKMTPSVAASQAMVRTPEGASVGGIIVNAVNDTVLVRCIQTISIVVGNP